MPAMCKLTLQQLLHRQCSNKPSQSDKYLKESEQAWYSGGEFYNMSQVWMSNKSDIIMVSSAMTVAWYSGGEFYNMSQVWMSNKSDIIMVSSAMTVGSAHRYHPCADSGGAKMNTRCPLKSVPSAAHFFTHSADSPCSRLRATAWEDNAALGSLQASPQAPGQTTGVAGARRAEDTLADLTLPPPG
ncbi:UNVERIFIED_CONTAM: hypothetical protein FKN15_017452 [Acipenser sinensis]